MDVSALNVDGEWLEIETENEDFGKLRVRVVPRQYGGLIRMAINEDMIQYLSELVVDWDISSNGEKVECSHANKMKYLSVLAGWRIKNPKYQREDIKMKSVGAEIIAFAQDIKNFTKNLQPTLN